jgi:hypothetical protein
MDMPTRQKTWVRAAKKPSKPQVSDGVKAELTTKAQGLIEEYLKPQHIKPPPKTDDFNYLIDLFTKWRGRYFYFCTKYASPGPYALSPTFDEQFARMEYAGKGLFNLSYKRHTGKWMEIYSGLTLDECLTSIRDEPHFLP